MSVVQSMKLDHDTAMRVVREKAAAMSRQVEAVRQQKIDGVHDMRVASRRLRAVLKEFKPALPDAALQPFEERVRSITQALGRARELDVMMAMARQYRKNADGPWLRGAESVLAQLGALRARESAHCHRAASLVACDEFRYELSDVLAALHERGMDDLDPANIQLWRRFKRLRKQYLEWNLHKDGPELHRVRITQKKLRYACELYQPLFGPEFAQLLKKLTTLHEVLGTWNDCRVLCDEIVQREQTAPYRAAQGYPLMREAFEQEGRDQRRAYEDLAGKFFGPRGRDKFKTYVKDAG